MNPTILISEDGTKYVIRGGKLVEQCLHKTRTDKSNSEARHEVCHDCGKTLIYSKTTKNYDTYNESIRNFTNRYGRKPCGEELRAMIF